MPRITVQFITPTHNSVRKFSQQCIQLWYVLALCSNVRFVRLALLHPTEFIQCIVYHIPDKIKLKKCHATKTKKIYVRFVAYGMRSKSFPFGFFLKLLLFSCADSLVRDIRNTCKICNGKCQLRYINSKSQNLYVTQKIIYDTGRRDVCDIRTDFYEWNRIVLTHTPIWIRIWITQQRLFFSKDIKNFYVQV